MARTPKIHLRYGNGLLCGGDWPDAIQVDHYEDVTCVNCQRKIEEIGFENFKQTNKGRPRKVHLARDGEPLCAVVTDKSLVTNKMEQVTCGRCLWRKKGLHRPNGVLMDNQTTLKELK